MVSKAAALLTAALSEPEELFQEWDQNDERDWPAEGSDVDPGIRLGQVVEIPNQCRFGVYELMENQERAMLEAESEEEDMFAKNARCDQEMYETLEERRARCDQETMQFYRTTNLVPHFLNNRTV